MIEGRSDKETIKLLCDYISMLNLRELRGDNVKEFAGHLGFYYPEIDTLVKENSTAPVYDWEKATIEYEKSFILEEVNPFERNLMTRSGYIFKE